MRPLISIMMVLAITALACSQTALTPFDAGSGATATSKATADSAPTSGKGEEITALLDRPIPDKGDAPAFIEACREALEKNPDDSHAAALCRKIGDVYLSIGNSSAMRSWYRKAIQIDPSLEKSTPIGYRLRQKAQVDLKRNAVLASLIVLALLLAILAVRMVLRRQEFAGVAFLKRSAIFIGAYAIVATVIFLVDAHIAARPMLAMSDARALELSINKPVIPLSACDASNPGLAAKLLLTGLLPIIFALCYSAFGRRRSRLLLASLTLLAAAALWTHFYFTHVYNQQENARNGWVIGRHVYIRAEPEELLVKDPQRALRANPDLLKSDNEDFREFMEKHYPNGFPGVQK